jgi:hypothetical protein
MFRLVVVLWCLSVGVGHAAELFLDFAQFKVGEAPAGFRNAVGGQGQPGDWRILLDEAPLALPPISVNSPIATKRPVLAQLARDPTDEHFPMLIYEGQTFSDFTLTTHFKLVEGEKEQMAGIAFRLQDEANYYYIRASGLGGTFTFFKVVNGVRGPPFSVNVPIPKGDWHELSITCKGTQIDARLNGKDALPTLDDKSFRSGKIAFWTKSDSVSHFTNTRLNYTPREVLAQILVRETLERYPRLKGLRILAAANGATEPCVLASSDPAELGKPATPEEADVIRRGMVYHGKGKGTVVVALPLHDSNGESVAAVRVVMKPFPGQTEKNAIARALPIVKQMEKRVRTLNDLAQ